VKNHFNRDNLPNLIAAGMILVLTIGLVVLVVLTLTGVIHLGSGGGGFLVCQHIGASSVCYHT
jgi:hypothetical protein